MHRSTFIKMNRLKDHSHLYGRPYNTGTDKLRYKDAGPRSREISPSHDQKRFSPGRRPESSRGERRAEKRRGGGRGRAGAEETPSDSETSPLEPIPLRIFNVDLENSRRNEVPSAF